jgi:hypothetical protein
MVSTLQAAPARGTGIVSTFQAAPAGTVNSHLDNLALNTQTFSSMASALSPTILRFKPDPPVHHALPCGSSYPPARSGWHPGLSAGFVDDFHADGFPIDGFPPATTERYQLTLAI